MKTYIINGSEVSRLSVAIQAIKKRKVFPTDDSVRKVIYLAIASASKKWSMPLQNWRLAMSRFIIALGGNYTELRTPSPQVGAQRHTFLFARPRIAEVPRPTTHVGHSQ
ncbi:hypothetical protein Pcaca05_26310 [Pectobacterium carotovorum subsp. carotovorum]|nr:hypothetical protein Pcaca05_26310 [Pectobacterium carotovorum subsp. carotovorum]